MLSSTTRRGSRIFSHYVGRGSSCCLSVRSAPFCTQNIEEPVISSSRTDTTAQLWKHRVKKDLLDEAKLKSMAKINDKNSPSFLVTKSPSYSHVSIDLSFGSTPTLREQYRSWQKNKVRLGKVLEDLDALAGNIAHTHADDNNPQTRPLQIVTACVDRVDVLRPFPLDIDLNMHGNVSYVGTSSMHIAVEVVEKAKPENRILTSSFLMVARDASTGKSTPVNHLDIQTDREKAEWILGEEAKAIRKKERAISLAHSPPTPDELKSLHESHFAKTKVEQTRPVIHTKDTSMSSVTVTQPQEKNTKDKIFGGYLMRKAYELSMATALKFCGPKTNPFLLAVDEISFHRPVAVGSLIYFDATVVYTTE